MTSTCMAGRCDNAMTIYFADTFYFLAMLNTADAFHKRAMEFNAVSAAILVTTTWVLTEVADALSAPKYRQLFVDLMDAIDNQPGIHVVPSDHELFVDGCILYKQRSDKSWSLTDCISFVVMEDKHIREALTADRHFEQAGFVALFAS